MVTRLDRLARSTRDLFNILDVIAKAGAGFKSLGDAWADTTTSHGRLMLTVLGGLAEFERELILTRTSDGRTRGKARGVKFGRPPRSQRTSVRRSFRGSRKARRRRTLRDPTLSRSPRFLGLLLPLSWKARPAPKAGQVAAAVKTVAKKRPRRSGAKFGVCGREGALRSNAIRGRGMRFPYHDQNFDL
jgi:DNA invertase Pin-like site-specific DNA recombinase